MSAAPQEPRVLFAAGYRSLMESVDNGKTWRPKKAPAGYQITAILTLSDRNVLVATDKGLFRTTDGVTWIQCAEGKILSLRGTQRKMFSALTTHEAMASNDGGISWKKCGDPGSAGNGARSATNGARSEWYAMDFDAAPSETALAATSRGLFRSADGCASWTPVTQGLRPETASLVLFHPTHAGEAFASQGGRVFRSTDGGVSWLSLDDDAEGNSGPSSLVVLPAAPDMLFALFPRRGVFATSIKEKTLQ